MLPTPFDDLRDANIHTLDLIESVVLYGKICLWNPLASSQKKDK